MGSATDIPQGSIPQSTPFLNSIKYLAINGGQSLPANYVRMEWSTRAKDKHS